MAVSLAEKLAAVARNAVWRMFIRSKVRLGLIDTPNGDRRLIVTADPKYTLPGLYEAVGRDMGVIPRRSALEEVRRAASGYMDAQAEAAKAAVGRAVHQIVKASGGVMTAEVKKDLMEALGDIMQRLTSTVERVVDTEATATRNYAGLDAIVVMNTKSGIDDPIIYWVTSGDAKVCDECVKLHTIDGITPRLWRLSEVSNAFHKRGDDRPSTLGLHPHCFVAGTRLHTNRGLERVEDLFVEGQPVSVTVDGRIQNNRTYPGRSKTNGGMGEPIAGEVWLNRHGQGVNTYQASHVYDTGVQPCLRVTLSNGLQIETSKGHDFWVDDGSMGVKVKANALKIGDKVPLLGGVGSFGSDHFPELAELMGNLMGDGCLTDDRATWRFFGDDIPYGEYLLRRAREWADKNSPMMLAKLRKTLTVTPPNDKYNVSSATVTSTMLGRVFRDEFGLSKKPRRVPNRLWTADLVTVAAFLRGLYAADGHSEGRSAGSAVVVISQNDLEFLREIQLLLSNFGIRTIIFTHGTETFSQQITYADGSIHDTIRKPSWRLHIGGMDQARLFADVIGMGVPTKQARLLSLIADAQEKKKTGRAAYKTARIVKIEQIGDRQTYCLTEPITNTVTANGIVIGQCRCVSSTVLPGYGFDAKGHVIFKGLDHDEFKKQRG